MRLDDSVAVVTGGGSGLGEALARRLARAGARRSATASGGWTCSSTARVAAAIVRAVRLESDRDSVNYRHPHPQPGLPSRRGPEATEAPCARRIASQLSPFERTGPFFPPFSAPSMVDRVKGEEQTAGTWDAKAAGYRRSAVRDKRWHRRAHAAPHRPRSALDPGDVRGGLD